jgi:hypothetical protein
MSYFMYMQYILDLCQHRLSTADHAKISVAYSTTAVGLLLALYCGHSHFHDFV